MGITISIFNSETIIKVTLGTLKQMSFTWAEYRSCRGGAWAGREGLAQYSEGQCPGLPQAVSTLNESLSLYKLWSFHLRDGDMPALPALQT